MTTQVRGMGYPESAHMITVGDVLEEVVRAREELPVIRLLAALMEEVGSLANAMLEGEPPKDIRSEAKQVAAVAIRIMEEVDHGKSWGHLREGLQRCPELPSWPWPPERRALTLATLVEESGD